MLLPLLLNLNMTGGGGGSFVVAWAKGVNTVLQPGVIR